MIDICKDLNEDQKKAVKADANTVVAAGAGSGKTKVLASRYVYLITEKNYQVENILALTFTDKAAAEMNQRIYAELKKYADTGDDEQDSESRIRIQRATAALDSFFKAQIMTLDSFCNRIAVQGCRRFGISPDFSINPAESQRLAYDLSLDFFLEHRADPALQYLLMGQPSISTFIDEFFVKFLNKYTTVSHPIDFSAALERQLSVVEPLFEQQCMEAADIYDSICSYFDVQDNYICALKEAASGMPSTPAHLDDPQLPLFIQILEKIAGVSQKKGRNVPEVQICKEYCKRLREIIPCLYGVLLFYTHRDDIRKIYGLCTQLQTRYIAEKKRRSILHFGDNAQLAVDALMTDPDLRLLYKRQIKRIMIDEFQDNNTLQRNLLFLLAEREDRTAQSIPDADELFPNKLFFVGDEKQSIYAFRGADVAVFRSLSRDLQNGSDSASINLQTNYRTEPELLHFFNSVFMKVFYSEQNKPESDSVPDFEAEFLPILQRPAVEGLQPQIDILYVDKKRFSAEMQPDTTVMTDLECEAYTLAQKMAAIYAEQYPVYDDKLKAVRPCTWSDFAVLFRTSTHQATYERFFRMFRIPYVSVQQKSLFSDAPLNDICALLRLVVYPNDRSVYAQVLRSPFVRLNDLSFTKLLLQSTEHSVQPFDRAAAKVLEGAEQNTFLQACDLFERLHRLIKKATNAELITALWYDEGYRYVLLSQLQYHRYLELYDYLFALAADADAAGLGLSGFIDTIVSYIHHEEKVDDIEIPLEQNSNAVKIMTIHKSKGLEFPIVCIPGCGSEGQNEKKEGLVFLHKELGPVIHLPREAKNGQCTSIFFEQMRKEANAKHLAETKRLLYVALTRAKVRLILSGAAESGCKEQNIPEEARTLQQIQGVLKQPEKVESNRSFFQLLLPAITQVFSSVHFTEVLPLPVSALKRAHEDSAAYSISAILEQYRQLPEKYFPLAAQRIIPATQFAKDQQWFSLTADPVIPAVRTDAEEEAGSNTEDTLSGSEFGTLVHKALEARFWGKPCPVPTKYAGEIDALCTSFFSSDMGKKALAAEFKKTEYGFLTLYSGKLVIGQIDLLFEYDNVVYVVDYKTDQKLYPERHREQLLIYKTAAENFYKMEGFGADMGKKETVKPVKAYIFYLRSQKAVEVE